MSKLTVVGTALFAVGLIAMPALAADRPNLETDWDIQRNFGVVPKFFHLFPESKLPEMWNAYKAIELNPNTALDAKTKELIAVAVGANARCQACVYFHTSAALANGATGREIQEAVAVSVVGGEWAKFLTATTVGLVMKDTNTLVTIGTLKAKPKAPGPTN